MKKEMIKSENTDVIEYTAEQKSAYKKVCNQISSSMKSLESNYLKLALALAVAQSERLYEVGGFQNVYDFAKDKYGLSRGVVYKYIGLVSVFGLTAESKPVYSLSQMLELLPYVRSGGSLAPFSPDMTVKQIRSKVRELSSVKALSGSASGTEAGSRRPSKRDVLMTLTCEEELQAQVDGLLHLILQALESGSEVQIVSY